MKTFKMEAIRFDGSAMLIRNEVAATAKDAIRAIKAINKEVIGRGIPMGFVEIRATEV